MNSILIVSQYYYPEQFSITHICEKLVELGYSITVLTGIPNYPMGEIYNGYVNKHYEELINGVKVIRVPLTPRKKGLVRNYISYAINASIKVDKINEDFDCVLVYEVSPITQVIPAYIYKKKHSKAKLLIYCQDIWPEVLINTGISKKSLIFKVSHIISKFLYKKGDHIIVTSALFSDYLYEEFLIPKSKCIYLPSYGDEWYLNVVKSNNVDKKRILFAGNMGKAQNLDVLIESVSKCKKKDFFIVDMVGNGSEIEHLKNKTKDLSLDKIILFHGRMSGEKLKYYYDIADAYFLSLNCDTRVCYTVPAKLQGYLAAGKPIISSIKGGGELVLEEAKAGIMAKYNDVDDLASKIDSFVECSDDYIFLGNNGRAYFKKYFVEEIYFKNLLNILS